MKLGYHDGHLLAHCRLEKVLWKTSANSELLISSLFKAACFRKFSASIQIPNVQACQTIMPTELFSWLVKKNYTTRRTPRLQEEPIRITTGEILGMSASMLSTATHVVSIPVHDTLEQRHREVSQLNIGCPEPLWQHANQCTPGFQSVTSRTREKGATLAQHMELHRNRSGESVYLLHYLQHSW